MPELSTQRISTILGYQIEGEEDLQALAETLGKTNKETAEQTEQTKKLSQAQKKNLVQDKAKAQQSRRARSNQLNINRAMEEARNIIADNTLRLENLKLEYEQGNVSSEEYRFELQKLQAQMERLDVPLTAVPRRMRQINREMQKVGTVSRGARPQIRGTSFAFNSMAQIVQDLPFGLVAISNNIPQAATGFSQLSTKVGGAGAAFKSLLGFATGPGGWLIVASTMISVLAVLIPKMDLFGKKTKEVSDEIKELKGLVSGQLGDIFGDLTDDQQVTALQNALDNFDPEKNGAADLVVNLDKMKDDVADMSKNWANMTPQMQENANNSEFIAGALNVVSDTQSDQIKKSSQINDLVKEELEKRLATAKANKLIAEQLELIGIEKRKQADVPELLDIYNPEIEDIDIDDSVVIPGKAEFQSYQKRFNTLFNNIKEDGIENFATLRDFETRFLNEIANDAALEEYQKEKLRTDIVNRFAERRNQIERRSAEQIKSMQDDVARAKEQTVETAVATIANLTQSLFGDSKGAAIAAIAIEKGYAIAKVLIRGIQESARLSILGTANLATPGFQALGAAQIAAAAKVKTIAAVNAGLIAAQGVAEGAQALSGGGGGAQGAGGGASNASYRYDYNGFKGGNDFNNGQRANNKNGVMVVELRDRAGKFLTRLQNAQDKEGGNNYLVPATDG